ncbi:MAG: hypothetical protein JXA21_22290 [Anaerolineae bacterium]|nr:hypothetical protein [Anaerolineae bacterium]
MSVEWIEYKGKRILYVDFRGLRNEGMLENLELEAKMLAETPGKVLVLGNFEGTRASNAFMDRLKQLGKEVIEDKVARNAVLGVTGLKEILMRAYNAVTGGKARPFATEAEALEWLVKA